MQSFRNNKKSESKDLVKAMLAHFSLKGSYSKYYSIYFISFLISFVIVLIGNACILANSNVSKRIKLFFSLKNMTSLWHKKVFNDKHCRSDFLVGKLCA